MSLAEATALTQGFVFPSDEAADLTALAKLAEQCERFSPLVGWETISEAETKPSHLFLDVTGIEALFGGDGAMTHEVASDLARWGYEANLAIADTIGAAWAHAVYRKPLPISALRLTTGTVDLLSQLGITQIEQLLKLPRASLPARFGEKLVLRLDQFQGTARETIVAHRPQPTFISEEVLENPVESYALIELIVRELVNRMAQMLAPRQQGAVRLFCRLDCASGPLTFQVGLFQPSADPQHLWDLVRMQLTLPGPVGRVTLVASQTAPLEIRQRKLFADSHDTARHLDLLIDRLSNRLGAKAVLRPELTADPLPERAVRYVPLVESGRKRRARKSPVHSATTRPLILHSPPRVLDVISIVPDGPPVSFRLAGQTHRVSCWWGPERIETGWWRGSQVRRDYYRVETDSGQRYWLFHRLSDGAWLLHGEFA